MNKTAACLSLAALAVISGCTEGPPESARLSFRLVKAADGGYAHIDAAAGARHFRLEEGHGQINAVIDLIKEQIARQPEGQSIHVYLRAEEDVDYEDDARIILACFKADAGKVMFEDVPVWVPSTQLVLKNLPAPGSFPRGFKSVARDGEVSPAQSGEIRIRVNLYDVGPEGEYVDGGKNEWLAIVLDEKTLPFEKGEPKQVARGVESSFRELQRRLKEKREKGLPDDTLVEIAPTMGCKHRWVVRACKAALAAGFQNVELAFPYQ